MTTDNPRELRSAAEWAKARDWGQLVLVPHNVNMLAGYILATVRDDDGEEQGDVTVDKGHDAIRVNAGGVFLLECSSDDQIERAVWLVTSRPTRGQFRALCRGLGIGPPDVSPATTDG